MRTLPIGDERVGASSTGDEIVVRSPFDGHEIDRVPACGAERGRRARSRAAKAARRDEPAAAVAAGRDPRPRRAPARRTHRGVRPHHRRRGGQADQDRARRGRSARCRRSRSRPSRPARSRARWCRSTRPTSARASSASPCGCPIGVVGAISPFNFPLNLVAHKLAPAIAAGCPVVLKPASQTPLSAIALGRAAARRVRPPERATSTSSPAAAAPSATPSSTTPTSRSSRSPARPRSGGASSARAPRKKVGLELGNNAPVIIEPDGDVDTAAAKIAVAGFSHAGQSCISTQRVYLHESIADALPRRAACPQVEALVVGDPLDEATDVSALISTGERERVESWIDEAVAAGAKVATGGDRAQRRARARPCSPNVAARHEGVQPRGVRPGGRGADLHATSTTRSGSPTTPATGSRPRSSPATCRSPSGPRASSTSAACWSTRCRPGAPTRCRTAACATAATPGRARTTRCTR